MLEENIINKSGDAESASTSSSFASASGASQSTYYYNRKGQLMIDDYGFIRGMVNGNQNTIYWRCAQAKKFKCTARVKSKGKVIVAKKIAHNHQPRREKAFSAIVWDDESENDII